MSKETITVLLQRVNSGEKELLNDIYERLYDEIKQIAQFQIAKLDTGQTITPTVLSHDCYLKLLKQNKITLDDKQHFLNCLSISMRQLLVDIYRSKLSFKRQSMAMVNNLTSIVGDNDVEYKIIELDLLLRKVEKISVKYAEILNYKLILAMTFPEIAEVKSMSERQVIRIWNQAKSLLMALSNKGNDNQNRTNRNLETGD